MKKSTDKLTVDEVHALVESSGKLNQPTPLINAILSLGVTIPLTLAVLPVSIAYQVGKGVFEQMLGKNEKALEHLVPIDSGIKVEGVIDRKDRKYDVVLLGSTGFTGKLAIRHLAKTYGTGLKWAIAGRSEAKLQKVKSAIAEELKKETSADFDVDTIIVDTRKPETLPGLVRDTRTVITTAGPFEKYGSPVVEACAKYGTHYVDITGETAWVRHMMLKWESTAQESGAKLISLCGCDSIPWDLTVFKLESALPEGETLQKVTCVDQFAGGASGGTLATMVMNIEGGTRGEPKHDFDPKYQLPDGSKSECETKTDLPAFVSQFNQPGRHKSMWLSPFVMSTINADVVSRSNALRGRSNGLTFFEAQASPDLKTSLSGFFQLPFLVVMLLNPITKYLLINFFLPKPGEGPTMDEMMNKSMLCVTGYGEGSKGTKVQSVLFYPYCAGYVETARMVCESGLCLALEDDRLPSKKGGFFTPSTGLGQVLMERLVKTGTYFASKVTKAE